MIKTRTCLLWFSLTLIHSYLFYQYDVGVNALIFSLLIVGSVTWHHGLYREKFWWMVVSGHLIAAAGVAIHSLSEGNAVYNVSFVMLAGCVFSARGSLFMTLINGVFGTVFVGFIRTVLRGLKQLQGLLLKPKQSFFLLKKMPLYVAPVSVTGIFYLLYSAANPDFFLQITFPDWDINAGLICCLFFGAMIVCPLLFPVGIRNLTEWDLGQSNILSRIRRKQKANNSTLGLIYENKQGVLMFFMLNTLIAVFLIFNIFQIFTQPIIQSAAGYSQQVHQGFETLVISIVVAILLIMYYFRGNQNFYEKKERLVQLAVLWIFLNGILILFTCYKNTLYVQSFGLTHKRIAVFIAMFLTGFGLYLTLIKIYRLKTNWYLIRQNAWVLYFVVSVNCLVDWDRLITWYNPTHAAILDMGYLMSLGDTRLPYLTQLLKAGDPRILPYKGQIENKIAAIHLPFQWQDETWDKAWLREELVEK